MDAVDLYLLGRLPPAFVQEFEEHYLSCSRCVSELKEARWVIPLIRLALAKGPTSGGARWSTPNVPGKPNLMYVLESA